jgi:hypothetical protein
MMKTRRPATCWVIYALLILSGMTGCTRTSQLVDEAPEVQIFMRLEPDPPLFGRPCRMAMTVLAADGMPINDAQLEIKGDMTHAGMVPVVVAITEGIDGVYTTALDWTMAGDWIVTGEASLSEGRVARRQFEVSVGVPGG